MGMGFRLNPKWGLLNQCSSFTNSLSRRSSSFYTVRGKEASVDMPRVSSLSIISEDGETVHKDIVKALPCPSAALQFLESNYSESDDIKMTVDQRSCNPSLNTIDGIQMPISEDKSRFQKQSKPTRFSLLLENLNFLEETIADSNMVRLERDIMTQLGRLGALQVFHTYLSRAIKTPSALDLADAPTELGNHQIENSMDNRTVNVIVSSGKREERKLRRRRAPEKANKISSMPFPSKTIHKNPQQPTAYATKRRSNPRNRRLKARNEVEMTRGVKVVADLERIRSTLEEQSGEIANLSSWAEAAEVDEKELLQHLHFGWYCRDELLKSSRSLVVYLARNYRGLGVPFEDLLQAGNLGVLQSAERFDPARGYKFSTYAQYWIRKAMSKFVARHSRGIYIPFSVRSAVNLTRRARKILQNDYGEPPNDDKIAEFTGLSLDKVRFASKCPRVVGSLDQKMGKCLNVKFLEFTHDKSIESPEDIVMRQHWGKDTFDLLKRLDPRERQVLVLRYGLENYPRKSLEEIGKLFKVSKEWIRKIERGALNKLRKEEEAIHSLSHYMNL